MRVDQARRRAQSQLSAGHRGGGGEAERQAAELVAEAGEQRADQAAGGVRHVVEADVHGDALGRGEGEDQVGVQRRVQREDHPEGEQPERRRVSRQPGRRRRRCPGEARAAPARRGSATSTPTQNRARPIGLRHGSALAPEQARRGRLDRAVADDPERHEASRRGRRRRGGRPACRRTARRRSRSGCRPRTRRRGRRTGTCRAAESQLMLRSLEKTSANFAPLRPRGRPAGMKTATATRISVSAAAMPSTAASKPASAEQRGAEQEADALDRVLRAGEQRHPAEQRAACWSGASSLDRALRAHLGEVLGDARDALHRHDEGDRDGDRPGRIELRQRDERADLQRQARRRASRSGRSARRSSRRRGW